ncbi:MAG: hypothetical protein MJ238_05985 [Bacilli bacterium]|nr:hypothetical protein [Bacilli bacterium]
MNKKTKTLIAIVLNIFTFVSAIWISADMFFTVGDGNMAVTSWRIFKYFTIDSNILCGLVCAAFAVYQVLNLVKNIEIPRWLTILKGSATAAISVTFFTVVFFLGPTQGYGYMFAGKNLFLHGITPGTAMIAYMFFEEGKLTWKETLYSIAPTALYSFFYVPFILAGVWEDFYGFTFGGKYAIMPVVIVIMYAASYGIGMIETTVKKLANK